MCCYLSKTKLSGPSDLWSEEKKRSVLSVFGTKSHNIMCGDFNNCPLAKTLFLW